MLTRSLNRTLQRSSLSKGTSARSFAFYSTADYNPKFMENIRKQHQIKGEKEYRFAIVGSGPAGFYMAKTLLQNVEKVRVDIYDRNPHPFGLIRTGVAPDHQAMKKIEKDFSSIFDQFPGKCAFFGNVWVGDKIEQTQEDFDIAKHHQADGTISVEKLREHYSGVILAHGALKDRQLGLPHESAKGILSSRRVVNWYTGSLDNDLNLEDEFNLEQAKNLSVIGSGNIFCDIARTLLKDPEVLHPTDMPSSVVEYLKRSRVENIQSFTRRGINHAAFTTKEIREISRVPGIELYMMKDEVQRSMTAASQAELNQDRARAVGRRTEFLLKTFKGIQNEEHYQEVLANGKKKLILRFLTSPSELVVADDHIRAVKFAQNKLIGDTGAQKAVLDESLPELEVPTDILVKSIGYKTVPITGVPFDYSRHTIPHHFGCVVDPEVGPEATIEGLYVAGWAKRGPVGIIDATLRDTKETFGILKHHIESGVLKQSSLSVPEVQEMLPNSATTVSFDEWGKINTFETSSAAEGKMREKILSRSEMVEVAKK